MPAVNRAVITDAPRVAAAAWAKRIMPGLAVPLDGIAGLVARLLESPIGSVSVVSADYDDCVGAYGLPAPLTRHVPLSYSVCKYVVGSDHVMAVQDMTADPEYQHHPSAVKFGIRSFAGVPLRDTADRPIGALTVVDYRPREWTTRQLSILVEVATLIGPVPAAPTDSPLGILGGDGNTAQHPAGSGAVHAEVQQSFLAALLDSLQVGVLAVDPRGEPVLLNRALRQIYAIPGDIPVDNAAAAMVYRPLRHPDGRLKSLDETAVRRALTGEQVRDARATLIAPGLPRRELLANSEPIHGPDGRLLGAVSTVLDVTERRREEQFRDAELHIATVLNKAYTIEDAAPQVVARLGSLLRSSYVALWLVDPIADVLRQATHWTAPGLTMSDVMPERIARGDPGPGRVWASGEPLFIPDLAESLEYTDERSHRFAEACIQRGLRTVVALPIRDGDTVLGVMTCLSPDLDGGATHLIGMLTGIAAQIAGFLARRRAADLSAQLAKARDDFIALVGHAVRTPLTSIHAYTELLHDDETQRPETREMLGVILRNAETLRNIVHDLLDLGALETGQHALNITDVDLVTIVDGAIRAARPAATIGGVTLTADLPPRLHLSADAGRLRQLLDNLLSNAIEYGGQGTVRVRGRRHDSIVELAVSDDGTGIPPEQRHRVFDRFFRADNVAHSAAAGTGLGLTLVRAIAEAHGGSAHLAEDGPGMCVLVRLPATPRPHWRLPQRPAPSPLPPEENR